MLTLPAVAAPACLDGENAFPSPYRTAAPFSAAIEQEASYPASPERLTGITVPHHLVAADLIARGFRIAAGHDYDRIVVLTPDHFLRVGSAFATTSRDFDTVFGEVETDAVATQSLLHAGAEESCLFAEEHGLLALLPFLKNGFPDTPIVPVAISIKSSRADWDRIAAALAPLVDERTLVVQSIDFSHYHPLERARQFDQQTLNLIADGSLDAIATLTQPDHLDSVGGLYVQTKLQQASPGVVPIVVASANQQAYVGRRIGETTGYLLIAHGPFAGKSSAHLPGGEIVYLAGDAQFGRAMTPALTDADAAERVAAAVLERTRGHPLVLNLEGVILPNVPEALPHMTIAMPEAFTLDWLKRLGVTAVGLANNHARDLGEAGLTETTTALDRAGIDWFGQGDRLELGKLTLVGLKDIDSNGPNYLNLVDDALLRRLTEPDPARPVAAFVHWGREYVATPGARELDLAERMRLNGATLVMGAHPHVASDRLVALGGGEALMAYSLGNFLFDQSADRASGALIELRVFEQGTVFARQVELPNLFDLAKPR